MKIPIFYQFSHVLMFSLLFFICTYCHIMCTNCYKIGPQIVNILTCSGVSIKASSITIWLSFPQVDNAVFYKCLRVGIGAYCCHMWLILLRSKWKYHNFMGGLFFGSLFVISGNFRFFIKYFFKNAIVHCTKCDNFS